MITIKRIIRLVRAGLFPETYMNWVNSGRCSFILSNDQDGWWTAQVGTAPECRRETMRQAILAAHKASDGLIEWD